MHRLYPILLLAYCFLPTAHTFSQGVWTQKASLPGTARAGAAGFSIGTKGYIGTGYSIISFTSYYYNDFWEWDQAGNVWTQKASFPGAARVSASSFSINNKGYIGIG